MSNAERPWMNPDLSVEERTEALLREMTREECISQLLQVRVDQVTSEQLQGALGSVILAASATAGNDAQEESSAEQVDALQRVAVEESRLGIPFISGRDVIHGHHTVFPVPLGQAASWDPDLVEQGCRVAAVEASADGIHWTFSPMVDICRDPRWGRIMEGYGESVHLMAELGAAAVRGYQTEDPSAPDAMAACAKHFAGYGAAEGGRDYNSTEITRSTLQDVYLPPFEALVKAGCLTFMSSFNEIDGISSAANPFLLDELLRKRWGFDGFVVTDWDAVRELLAHGIAADGAEAAAKCLNAGADMNMVDGLYAEHLPALLAEGIVSEASLREAVRRILRVKFRLGLFERPYTGKRVVDRAPHKQLARNVAARCCVMLKRGRSLPLPEEESLALLGPLATATQDLFGSWTLDGIPGEVLSLLDAFREAEPERKILHADWGDSSGMDHAVAWANRVLLVLGESASRSGEAHSVGDPTLPPGQTELLEQVLRLGKPVILLVIAGRPLVLPEAAQRCDSILYSFHPGSEGGRGLADVVLGRVEPEGRLPVTLPRSVGQIPLYYDHKPTGRPTDEYHRPEGSPGGMRLIDQPGSPLYRFGYGLGYSRYELGEPRVLEASIENGIRVELQVKNVGEHAGSTVIQAYTRIPVAERSQPVRQLSAFQRVRLAAGEEMRCTLQIQPEILAYTHLDGERRVDAGPVHLWIGLHASDGKRIELSL